MYPRQNSNCFSRKIHECLRTGHQPKTVSKPDLKQKSLSRLPSTILRLGRHMLTKTLNNTKINTLSGIGLLRQQILPWDRVHAVVVDGGEVANIIPERAELSLMVRSKYPETLKDLVGRVEDVLRGAALMSGTGVRIIVPDYTNEMPVRANGPLTAAWVRSQRERGRDPLPFGVVPETIAVI